ncbi:MAG: peptidase S10 [Rhodobacteraceae bacterium]|nr:peptidase S10 [Paracoccaceae bacterium]
MLAPLRLVVLLALMAPGSGFAQVDAAEPAPLRNTVAADAQEQARLPPPRTTEHALAFGDRQLEFTATAGAVTLRSQDSAAEPEADIGYVAYLAAASDPASRPVTFVVNGGPGAASAYLHIGALGPWRLPLEGGRIAPSQPVALEPNAETWLDFTDLVFVDPVGAGFSRLVDPDDELRRRYLSIGGDIEALAQFVLQWLTENGRIASPKYFVGESYGGFRGPLLAETLQTEYGVGLSGLILVSPVLDFGWRLQPNHAPLPRVALLPSFAAAAMERRGAFSAPAIAEVEAYAAGEYLTDLLRGLDDGAATTRLVARLTELTGVPAEVVERTAGRLSLGVFTQELFRDARQVASAYDAAVAGDDPSPGDRGGPHLDPVLDALTAPLTGGMIAHYQNRLDWLPDRRYVLLNGGVNHSWDWGGGLNQPEAVGPLAKALALDPDLRVLVAHGYTDLVTPYFASELILRQLADFGPGGRIALATYPGGHMFYTRDASRRAFRENALTLYAAD